jgi:hypothetical protein
LLPHYLPGGDKVKTLAELEMESPEGFRNPISTPEQNARLEKMHSERKAVPRNQIPNQSRPPIKPPMETLSSPNQQLFQSP